MTKRSALLIIFVLALAGCDLKGDLYIPEPEETTETEDGVDNDAESKPAEANPD